METRLARFHHGGILKAVAQAEGAVVVEVVSQEHVGGRSLLGDRLQRGVRFEHRHHGQPAAVGNSQQPTRPLLWGTFFSSQSMVS